VPDTEIRLHPLAADEAQTVGRWYRDRNIVVADGFLRELDAAIEGIAEGPERWPRIYGRYRRFLLHKFPFSVVYIRREGFVEVVAIAHHRRQPGYWKHR
jgi:plasmid stabilization system protein ParE